MVKTVKRNIEFKMKMKNIKEIKAIDKIDKMKLFIVHEDSNIRISCLDDLREHIKEVNIHKLDYAIYPKIKEDIIYFRCLPLPESA